MTNLEKAQKIIKENIYLTLSVSGGEGNPWIANLYYACDKNYNFYWYSSKNAIHSHYLKENPNVAFAIFNSMAVGEGVDAVYVKARANEVSERKELVAGLVCYAKKMLATRLMGSKSDTMRFIKQYRDFQGMSVLRLYKAVPEKVWKLAPSGMYNGKFIDSRIEVDLI